MFIGNIPYDAQEDDLRNIFSRVGAVDSLRLVYDKDTKQPKGYGFCDYSDPDTAMSAVRNLNDAECNGRRLRIDLADNALRSRELPPKLAAPALPLSLPAPEPQPRPALPPSVVPLAGSPQLALPMPAGVLPIRPLGPPSPPAGVVDPLTDGVGAGATSPEAIIGAVSACTEIAQMVAAMPQAQLQLCLGAMQQLALETPENARAFLQENPQLCYALLHAQFVLGLTLDPLPPPTDEEIQQLRAEAARRPTVAPLVAPMTGVVVPPALPGMPGGPPRAVLVAPVLPQLRTIVPGLPGASVPPHLLAGTPAVIRPLGFQVVPPVVSTGGAFSGPAGLGLLRPPVAAPRLPMMPGLTPKPSMPPARPLGMG